MRAGKAYISSLGTTGVLIASSLLLLAVVGAMLAFDRWPDNAAAETDVVAIAAAETATELTSPSRERAVRASADRRSAATDRRTRARFPRVAARAASVQVAADSDSLTKASPPSDPVVTELPAPDAADGSPSVSAPAPGDAAPTPDAPAQPRLPTPDEILPDPDEETVGLSVVTAPVSESLTPLSPELGTAVRRTGDGIDGTLSGLVEATSAGTER